MSIQRYQHYIGESYLDECDSGEWVKHEDHLAEVERLRSETRAMVEEMAKYVEGYFFDIAEINDIATKHGIDLTK
jgi:selenocysteine lyase/cysteine desulfurase